MYTFDRPTVPAAGQGSTRVPVEKVEHLRRLLNFAAELPCEQIVVLGLVAAKCVGEYWKSLREAEAREAQ